MDAGEGGGPAAGLEAALNRFPAAAWLPVAADMPLLDKRLLGRLCEQRDPTGLATAFRRDDGIPEQPADDAEIRHYLEAQRPRFM